MPGMDEELPTQRVAGIEYLACEWCGEAVSQLGTRTPRRYCKRSHRQRAFEKRRLERARAAEPTPEPGELPARPPLPPPTEWLPIREPSPDLDARLDALAGPEPDDEPDDPDPVSPVQRSSLPLPPPGPRGKRLFPPFPAGRARPEGQVPTLWEDDHPPAT